MHLLAFGFPLLLVSGGWYLSLMGEPMHYVDERLAVATVGLMAAVGLITAGLLV